MTKTALITAPLPEVYRKAYQWLSLQEYAIKDEIKNQRLIVCPQNRGSAFVGIILLLLGLIPGIIYLATTETWKITITFEGDDSSAFVKAEYRDTGEKVAQIVRNLTSTLSMLNK